MVDGQPVTPRHGLAVELNALWYNALCFYLEVAEKPLAHLREAKGAAASAFGPVFWLADRGYLADVVRPDAGPDTAMRPNQLLAVALPYGVLSGEQGLSVVRRVKESLATPFGLRTLSPDHPSYVPRYEGGVAERDRAYHQGTVWAWLIGPYVEASLRVAPDRAVAARDLLAQFEPLYSRHLGEAGLWSVSEIFDGEAPHAPRGAIAQAWSVAEMIRAKTMIDRSLAGEPLN